MSQDQSEAPGKVNHFHLRARDETARGGDWRPAARTMTAQGGETAQLEGLPPTSGHLQWHQADLRPNPRGQKSCQCPILVYFLKFYFSPFDYQSLLK